MEQSPWEPNSYLASQEICHILWNFKVYYHVNSSLPLNIITSQWIQSTSSNHISLKLILILSSHLHLNLPSGLFPAGFQTKMLNIFLIFIMCYMPHTAHLSNVIWLRVQIMKSWDFKFPWRWRWFKLRSFWAVMPYSIAVGYHSE